MRERFGPWSSALGDPGSPHLSTFWKRRLSLLTTVQAARRTLTRRDWLKLGAAGTAACALPTLHLASAGGPDDPKVADQGKIYVRANFKLGGGENDGIFVVDPETSNWTKITEFKSGNVRVSRDGRMLALIDY